MFFISFKYFYFSGVSQSFIPRERGAESKCEPGDFSKLVKPAAVYTPGHGARTILGHVCSSSADTDVPLFPGVNPKLQLDKLSWTLLKTGLKDQNKRTVSVLLCSDVCPPGLSCPGIKEDIYTSASSFILYLFKQF